MGPTHIWYTKPYHSKSWKKSPKNYFKPSSSIQQPGDQIVRWLRKAPSILFCLLFLIMKKSVDPYWYLFILLSFITYKNRTRIVFFLYLLICSQVCVHVCFVRCTLCWHSEQTTFFPYVFSHTVFKSWVYHCPRAISSDNHTQMEAIIYKVESWLSLPTIIWFI